MEKKRNEKDYFQRRWSRGFSPCFTLMEVLVTVALAGILFSAVYGLLIAGLKNWEQENVKTKLTAFNSEVVMRTLEQELRAARTITVAKDREVEFTTCGRSVPEADDYTLALWHCDEGEGTAVADGDGRAPFPGAALMAAGQPAWTPAGEHSWGLDFNRAAGDYVWCGTISIVASFTLEAWIKPDTVSAGTEAAIIYQNNSYRLYLSSADKLVGGVYSLGWLDVTSTEAVDRSGNVWTYVALTYNQPTGKLVLFINGKIAGSAVYGAAVNSVGMSIGTDGVGMFFDGIIDEIRISNTARSMKTKFSWSGTFFSQSGNYTARLIKADDEGSYPLEEGYVSTFQLDYYRKDGRQFVPVAQNQRDQVDSVKVRLTLLEDKNKNGIEDTGEIKESIDNVIHLRN